MRTSEQNILLARAEKKAARLEKQNRKIEKEMWERGKELTKIIRIFLAVEHLIPEEQRIEIRGVAESWARRQDDARGSCYAYGSIDFQEAKGTYEDTEQ